MNELVLALEHENRLLRGKIRELEQLTGPSDATGEYWFRRTAALEHVAHAVRTGNELSLRRAFKALDAIQAPACREGDHAAL